MNTMPIALTGLPWYEPETYQRVCALMSDTHKLFGTYADWLAAAQRTEQQLRRQGQRTVRVPLDLVQFPAWCAAKRPGQNIDADARMQDASYMAAQLHMAGQSEPGH